MKKQVKKIKTIKSKMLIYAMMIVILMTFLSAYTLFSINIYKGQIDDMFQRNVLLKEVNDLLEDIDHELLSFLNSKNSQNLNNYMMKSEELRQMSSEISQQIVGSSDEELMLMDIIFMMNNYMSEAELAVSEKRKNDIDASSTRYNNAFKIKGYIISYINELNIRQFGRNAQNYLYMSEQIRRTSFVNIVLIIDLIALSILIVITMTNKMINPIVRLSHSAEDIARGRFDTEAIVVESDDEIEILATAFNKMKNSIKLYIDELQEKAETEAKLKEQELENLKMQNLLDNAKLYALQSQINPHFLFNTINAGVQMAMLEGADSTSEFLESMSRLFRYNIKEIDSEVTLSQEMSNIKDYYELLKVRFGDLIYFRFMLDESVKNLRMPPLILQPIVENSYIHGLSSKEDGGTINIRCFMNHGDMHIIISDNGVGMDQETIHALMSGAPKEHNLESRSAGVGMRNVIDRLELFYGINNIVEIESKVGEGTMVKIIIPYDASFFVQKS